jgi:hypothetical protein
MPHVLSQDANAMPYTLDSGHIGDKVSLLLFSIADHDRVTGKSGVDITLIFTPSKGGQLFDGTAIFVNIPSGFFASSSIPSYYHSNTLARSRVSLSDEMIEIQMAGTGIARANQSFCITLRGFVMGAVTRGSTTGISVSTSQVSSYN